MKNEFFDPEFWRHKDLNAEEEILHGAIDQSNKFICDYQRQIQAIQQMRQILAQEGVVVKAIPMRVSNPQARSVNLTCNHTFTTRHLFTSTYQVCTKCGKEE